jgi:hypothetical protein
MPPRIPTRPNIQFDVLPGLHTILLTGLPYPIIGKEKCQTERGICRYLADLIDLWYTGPGRDEVLSQITC